MAHSFMRPSGTKRATSLMLSIVMLATMVMPAFAAPVITPSNYKAGTLSSGATNITSVDGTGSAGFLGVYSFEVTGTPATRAFVQSEVQYPTDATRLITLGDLNVPSPLDPNTFPIIHYSDDTTTFDTALTTLTLGSTITQFKDEINNKFGAYMTADFDAAFRLRITAKKVGYVEIGISDAFTITTTPKRMGMADVVFGGLTDTNEWTALRGTTYGTDYSIPYGAVGGVASFKPLGGKKYPVSADMGHLAAGVFVSGVNPSTGYYSAMKLGSGHDFVIYNNGTKLSTDSSADIRPGFASFEAADGVRAPMGNLTSITQGANKEAGQEETITVVVSNTGGLADATNGARVVLPAGSTVASPTSVISSDPTATITVSLDRSTIEFTNFQSDGSGDTNAPASATPFTATIRVKNPTASDHKLGLDGSAAKPYRKASLLTRNVAGTAWTAIPTTDFRVTSEDKVARVGLASTEINAGGFSKITGQLFDQYDNEIVEYGRAINFDLASSTPTPTGSFVGSLIPTQAVIATTTPSSPFVQSFKTSITPGENVVRATVLRTATGTETVSQPTTIDTRNVGNPYQVLVLEKDGKTAFPTTGTPTFYVKVVDQAGKGTSFLAPRKVKVVKSDKYGNESTRWADIPAGYSTSADFGFALPMPTRADTWKLTATDWFGGAALPSNVLSIDFSSAVIPGAPFEMKVSAVKPIPGDSMDTDYNEFLFNNAYIFGIDAAAFGYANADGQQAVEFTAQVVDNAGMPINQAGIEVTYTIPAPPAGFISGVTYPGVLSAKTGVTDANGRVTVKMTSTVGSRERYAPVDFSTDWDTTYFTPVSFETTLPASQFDYGFGYFVKGKLVHMSTDKDTILADGTDAATITAHAVDQAFGMPAAGVPLTLSTSAGTISGTSAVTGADGKATVSLKSDSMNPSSATVVAIDPDGNRASVNVEFSDLRINVAPVGSGTAQGGYGASQDVRVSFSRLDGTPVLFDDFDADSLYFDGGYLDFSKYETATAEGGIVLNSAAIYTATLEGGNAIGSWNVEVASVGVWRNLVIFGFNDYAPQMASTKLTFVNNATFSATYTLDDPFGYRGDRLAYTAGNKGFNPPATDIARLVEVELVGAVSDYDYYSEPWMAPAYVYKDGSIKVDLNAQHNSLDYLQPGMKYDLKVDGILFEDALEVYAYQKPAPEVKIQSGPSPAGYGTLISGNAYFPLSSSVLQGALVELQYWNEATAKWASVDWADVKAATVDANGNFGWTMPELPTGSPVKYLRAVVLEQGENAAGYSFPDTNPVGASATTLKYHVVTLIGRAKSTVSVYAPTTAKANVSFLVKGRATSARANETVTVKVYRKSGGKYVLSKTYSTKMGSSSYFSLKINRPAGYYKIACFYNGGSGVDYTSVR